jgi:hypothetical protein
MQSILVTRVTVAATVLGVILACTTWIARPSSAGEKVSREPAAIPTDQFVKLHALIKPQLGELRFHEIPWLIDVWEARKQAAAEGKPILVWSGAGGAPIGVC